MDHRTVKHKVCFMRLGAVFIPAYYSQYLQSRVYDHSPPACTSSVADTAVEAFQGLNRHGRRYFSCCSANEKIACDVDEVLWPARNIRQDAATLVFFFTVYPGGLFSLFYSFFCMKNTLQIQLCLLRCIDSISQ